MGVLLSIPAVLSSLILGAHFVRVGRLELAMVCAVAPVLLLIRRGWGVLLYQWMLLAGAVLWLWTMLEIAQMRSMMHQPAGRMMAIIGGVAMFSILSAVLLEVGFKRRRAMV